MHPVIRISIFLIFTYFIIQVKPAQLLLSGFILFGASYFQAKKYTVMMWSMVWRLKWFYLSIFLLFGFLTPNDVSSFEVHDFLLGNLNSGFYFALVKIIALILIVMSVIVLIVSIPRNELISALVLLSKPFSVIGFSSERFAMRVYLIIEFTETLPSVINSHPLKKKSKPNLKAKIKHVVSSLCIIFTDVYELAENSECKKMQYDKISLPNFPQWGYLILCIGLFYFSDIVFTEMVE